MCKAKEYSNQFLNLCENLRKDYNGLVSENSKTDLMIQDLLHEIEFGNFNASQGYKLAKRIKDVRCERRGVKDELETMQALVSQVEPIVDKFKKAEDRVIGIQKSQKNRKYNPRILDSTL